MSHKIYGGEQTRQDLIKNDEAYFELLQQADFFSKLSQMDVMALLRENLTEQGVYSVDMKNLRDVLKPFLEEHEKLFLPYLERTRAIIGK